MVAQIFLDPRCVAHAEREEEKKRGWASARFDLTHGLGREPIGDVALLIEELVVAMPGSVPFLLRDFHGCVD